MWQLLPPQALEAIFIHIRDDASDSLTGDCQLARLARVCKHWSEPALKLLWSHCSDLTLLVHTLPVEILAISSRDGPLVSVVGNCRGRFYDTRLRNSYESLSNRTWIVSYFILVGYYS